VPKPDNFEPLPLTEEYWRGYWDGEADAWAALPPDVQELKRLVSSVEVAKDGCWQYHGGVVIIKQDEFERMQ
jgi:hypothetical protein